ncbi:HsdR family type I site-specific deoxyribonuclease [Priestia megaterium]|uniref:type I restriction endonuclease subunit R n=1 Tax=Priestia megaterium TaxID=1404 RepID=UPI002E24233A|nr:HsdR family type I site-specific deoxyribonuclease [Priestia megaterium]MED4051548.1 HsdR family type I site-specific deoxyribonuclease [Priestia megaterium]
MIFNEANSVQNYIKVLLELQGWTFISPSEITRTNKDVFIEEVLINSLKKLNPEIQKNDDYAEQVLHKLRALYIDVKNTGLVKSNERFISWLRGELTMPFGENNQHVTIRLIDFEKPNNNFFMFTTELKNSNTREDLILFVNGFPVSIGECKTPFRPAITWVDGALQVLNYEKKTPELFVSNIFNFVADGKEFKYATINSPLEHWASWRDFEGEFINLNNIEFAVNELLNPETLLDIIQNFIIFSTNSTNQKRIKIICRAQQYEAVNKIVKRVREGVIKQGLIWHFQGSGKSLLMLFAALKLRNDKVLKSPTVLVIVDRKDLDNQIIGTFSAADVPNMAKGSTIKELKKLLLQDTRKIIVTTIFRFKEIKTVLNERENIIALVDEAHRTQEGDLGLRMRNALPNASFFGLTGTPINKRDRNTFATFGAAEDAEGYMSKYSFEDSILDGATKSLKFESRLVHLHIDKEAMKLEFDALTDRLGDLEKKELIKRSGKFSTLVQSPERIEAICKDIAEHYKNLIEPQGFKAMVICNDRESCLKYKEQLDKYMDQSQTTIVMTIKPGESDDYMKYNRTSDEEKQLLEDQFKKPLGPLKILIVTAKLLTGFDAPILQTIYLDKPLKEHTLLQAICRTNRLYPNKEFGLIVDYIGVFDEVGKALSFDLTTMRKVVTDIEKYKSEIPVVLLKCLAYFEKVDRSKEGFEGIIEAQECLPDNEVRDKFGTDFSYLSKLWEAVSPNDYLNNFVDDFRWLSYIYESIRPSNGQGELVWHTLGPKTIEIINRNIHVLNITDDLEKLVLDAEILDKVQKTKKEIKEIEYKVAKRIRDNLNKSRKFKELGDKLEEVRLRYEARITDSIMFLKELLELAKQVLEAEKKVDSSKKVQNAKSALTELFQDIKSKNTQIIVERIVEDIDKVVMLVRFDDWQATNAGEFAVKKALRKTLSKYQLHKDMDLYSRAYEYIKQYY